MRTNASTPEPSPPAQAASPGPPAPIAAGKSCSSPLVSAQLPRRCEFSPKSVPASMEIVARRQIPPQGTEQPRRTSQISCCLWRRPLPPNMASAKKCSPRLAVETQRASGVLELLLAPAEVSMQALAAPSVQTMAKPSVSALDSQSVHALADSSVPALAQPVVLVLSSPTAPIRSGSRRSPVAAELPLSSRPQLANLPPPSSPATSSSAFASRWAAP